MDSRVRGEHSGGCGVEEGEGRRLRTRMTQSDARRSAGRRRVGGRWREGAREEEKVCFEWIKSKSEKRGLLDGTREDERTKRSSEKEPTGRNVWVENV